MYQAICDAIQNKTVLNLYYNGHMRVVEPHVLGVSVDGRILLARVIVHRAGRRTKHREWSGVAALEELEILIVVIHTKLAADRRIDRR